jgi:hypothetical protein
MALAIPPSMGIPYGLSDAEQASPLADRFAAEIGFDLGHVN